MHAYTKEYYSAIIKNEIMPFAATLIDLEIIILSEESQTEKHKLRKNDINELISKTETDTQT